MANKNKAVPAMPTYQEPKRFEGTCTLCNHTNARYDWDNNMKAAPFAQMYCSYCGFETTHTNVKEVQ
jgi:hypothetical protein